MQTGNRDVLQHPVKIPVDGVTLDGDLSIPEGAEGLVLFAHGSGSSRHSPRNRYVAGVLQQAGLATLLMDLLTRAEEQVDQYTRHLRFDIGLLARRLVAATDWVVKEPETKGFNIGCFGASTGAAAAIVTAVERPSVIKAVVSRGGRPDLAGEDAPRLQAPLLLIVGGDDAQVLELNRQVLEVVPGEKKLEIIPGATHLFEEPGALEEAARLAASWFVRYLRAEGG